MFSIPVLLLACCVGGSWSVDPPRFINEESGVVEVEADDSLQLQCAGSRDLLWNASLTQEPIINKTMENNTFVSTFTVNDPRREETGYYYCYYAGAKNLDDKENVASIFVLIKAGATEASISGDSTSIITIVVSVVSVTILLILVIFIARNEKVHGKYIAPLSSGEFYRIVFQKHIFHFKPSYPSDGQTDLFRNGQNCEVAKDRIVEGRLIRTSNYGWIMGGTVRGIEGPDPTNVAIRVYRNELGVSYIKELAHELKVTVLLGKHRNIVQLLGVSTAEISKGEVWVVAELCPFGDVVNFLHTSRGKFVNQLNPTTGCIDITKESTEERQEEDKMPGVDIPLTTTHLLNWSLQIARGMEYISSRRVVHGNLVGRNVLLANNNVVKITGFSLSRALHKKDFYVAKPGVKIALKWQPVETVEDRIFSTQSDVWSYGITLWEIFTLGNYPYPAYDVNEEFMKRLEGGYRMPCPKNYANEEIYKLMMDCWANNRTDRIPFRQIIDRLNTILKPNAQAVVADSRKDATGQVNIQSPEAVSYTNPLMVSDSASPATGETSSSDPIPEVTVTPL